MTARGTRKPTLRSTDRGGPVSLTAGILCLALGFGLLIGVNSTALNISSATIAGLKDMAMGLGGALYTLVPFFVLWLGWLLFVSARHYISFRGFVLSFSIYLCVLAFLTLTTSISGFGSLMDYVLNMNEKLLARPAPDTYGEYLARAFQKYGNKLTPLPGGGALGMLVAFPVWRLLGIVGGAIALSLGAIGLLLGLLRQNPALWLQKLDKRFQQHGAREVPVQAVQPAAQPSEPPVEEAPGQQPMQYQPRTQPYYVEPMTEAPIPPPQQPVMPVSQPQPTAPQPAAASWEEDPLEAGFTSVSQDFYEQFDQEPPPAVKPRTRRAHKRPERTPAPAATPEADRNDTIAQSPPATRETMPAQPVPVAEAPPTPVQQPAPQQPATHASQTAEQPLPWEEETLKSDQEKTPSATARPVPAGKPREVGVAPAVALDGARVPVQPKAAPLPAQARRQDGTPKAKRQERQLSMPMDAYERPPSRLLTVPLASDLPDTTEEDLQRAGKLISTLDSFNISATVQQIVHGPAITRFAIRLAEGVNVNRLRNVMDNLAVELLAKSAIRAEIPIPGTPLIGIEVSNEKSEIVHLSEVLHAPKMRERTSPTAVALGKDITGSPIICELMDMPHLLIAGATGSGKSVCINAIITSLLYRSTPREVRMILVDPKLVELQPYNDVPHLLLPVVVDPKKAVSALEWVCQEMDERYMKLQKLGVRNIDAYNRKLAPDEEPLPRIIVIIDEMSDLMASAGKIIDEHVKRITAKARAAGICLILATQRPSVDVITGIIKANIPSRIAFQVSSQVDSRTILDAQGAEKLLGYGDMLYLPRMLSAPKRVQGCFISDKEVGQVTEYVKSRNTADYNVNIMEHIEAADKPSGGASGIGGDEGTDAFDELLPKAIEMAVEAGQMSISMLQRVLRVGYGRAGRLIDEMERREIISGNEGTKPRKTLITREEYQELFGEDTF